MADEKKAATKEYVVVFDALGVHTGNFTNPGPGMTPLAVTETKHRGDVVQLSEEDAQRHLESGAVIAKSDKRAKDIKKNAEATTGVRRDANVSLGPVALEQTAPAVAGGEGARREAAGSLGNKAELSKRSVVELKELAAQHGVTVERGDTKPKLAAKLAKLDTGAGAGAGAGEPGHNPGQKDDQSPPPEDQPDESPE